MATSTTTPFEVPSDRTLSEVPKRAFTFLNALGTHVVLRAQMKAHGYQQDDHLEGWDLLLKASRSGAELNAPARSAAAGAIDELDAWDEIGFHKAHAALARKYPAQAAYVFRDLAPTQGPAAVLGITTFLDRLDVLEKGDGRAETRDVDQQALATLAMRGVGADERTRLRKLIEVAQSEPVMPASVTATVELEAERKARLAELYAWYCQWIEVAQAVVPRRADRVLLGIAKRKKRHGDNEALAGNPPQVPVSGSAAPTGVSVPLNGARFGALAPPA